MKNVFVDDSYLTATANAIRAKNNSTDTYKPSEFANAIASISGGGADGVGIQSVVQTTTSAEDGGTNVITVTKTDGTTSTFQVKNGSKGSDGVPGADGKDGADGQPGADGKSAYQYAKDGGYTGTEEEFAAKMAQEIPTVDATLTQAGQAADAAAVGEQLGNLSDNIDAYTKSQMDDIIASLIGTTQQQYNTAMRHWFRANGAEGATHTELTALCDRWYTITRTGWDGSVSFYQPDVSAVSTGMRGGDNAGLTCTPSTDTVAGQDDYAGLPLFACVDVNWIVDADTLEPVITAIDGITDNFVRDDPDIFVGVVQMSGYHWQAEDDTTYTHGYTDTLKPYANVEPVPEAVRVDGTVRPWVVHGKYMSCTVNGKMTCCAGLIPTALNSHNTLHTLSAKNGAQYSGSTTADDSWLKLMAYIKYASLTLDGILQGCCNNNYQYPAAVSETGVKRVLVTTAQAANFDIGMSVLVGNYAGSMDRGQTAMYSITGNGGAVVTAIETVTIDGAEYGAVYVDTADVFDTAANGASATGTTYISTCHWRSGMTDGVLGNDGSPINCTNGKYPAKLQGIEYMVGGYEVYADVILNLYQDGDTYYYEPYIVRRSAQQATSVTSNYKASGLKCAQPASVGWQYIKRMGYASGVCFPIMVGGSSSTYARDAFYMNNNATGTREWLAFGGLGYGVGIGGVSCLSGVSALSSANWSVLARLSPNGNRGEWAA